MEFSVELSDRARRDIEEIAEFLTSNWSAKTKMDFLLALTKQMELISKMPYLYKASQKKIDVRECIMNKHTVIYYRVLSDSVEIITVQGTKQERTEF
jgi:plasmid stabilization system protein ParE